MISIGNWRYDNAFEWLHDDTLTMKDTIFIIATYVGCLMISVALSNLCLVKVGRAEFAANFVPAVALAACFTAPVGLPTMGLSSTV